MPVIPYCHQQFQSRQNLYQFLAVCKQQISDKNHSQIISISQEIERVDPLVILAHLAQPQQLNFYFEKRPIAPEIYTHTQNTAIAAIGSAVQFQTEGSDRFTQAKAFIQQTLANMIVVGDPVTPFAQPHFCCSFGFFHTPFAAEVFPAASVFLPAWQIASQPDCSTVVANVVVTAALDLESTVEQLWQTFHTIRGTRHALLKSPLTAPDLRQQRDVTDPAGFKAAVRSVLAEIRSQALNKVVLAHAVDVFSPLPFNLAQSLDNLRTLYPDCHVFLSSNGKGQHFMGASPERLVRLQHQELVTDALAGSAPRGQTPCEDAQFADRLLHSTKELHEHQVVRDFITRQLNQLALTAQPSPLRLLQLSNIQHLQTPIHATVPADLHLLDIVANLHPTPAVAGVPRDLACKLICQHETFSRSLYAAPIGWVDRQGNGEFAVGIRSAVIDGCQARLFAGAGIVAGSTPDRELAEVKLKLRALLAALV